MGYICWLLLYRGCPRSLRDGAGSSDRPGGHLGPLRGRLSFPTGYTRASVFPQHEARGALAGKASQVIQAVRELRAFASTEVPSGTGTELSPRGYPVPARTDRVRDAGGFDGELPGAERTHLGPGGTEIQRRAGQLERRAVAQVRRGPGARCGAQALKLVLAQVAIGARVASHLLPACGLDPPGGLESRATPRGAGALGFLHPLQRVAFGPTAVGGQPGETPQRLVLQGAVGSPAFQRHPEQKVFGAPSGPRACPQECKHRAELCAPAHGAERPAAQTAGLLGRQPLDGSVVQAVAGPRGRAARAVGGGVLAPARPRPESLPEEAQGERRPHLGGPSPTAVPDLDLSRPGRGAVPRARSPPPTAGSPPLPPPHSSQSPLLPRIPTTLLAANLFP